MKKLFVLFAVLVTVAVIALVVWLPAKYVVSTSVAIQGNANAANRIMGSDSIWAIYAGNAGVATDSGLQMKTNRFKVMQSSMGQITVGINGQHQQALAQILFVQMGRDSLLINWETNLVSSTGLMDRIQLIFDKKELAKEQEILLSLFKSNLEKSEKLYGINIVPGNMTDSVVLTTSFTSKEKPDMATVYAQIDLLEQYAASQQAGTTNSPMLFIQKNPNGEGYKTQVALPINKYLEESKGLSCKRMVLGKNLTSYVKGPQSQIDKAYKAMYQYVNDRNIMMPGIPYEMLITNRMKVADSTLWETKIYFPSM
jgi:effector-binding domain-containing protein